MGLKAMQETTSTRPESMIKVILSYTKVLVAAENGEVIN